MECEPQTIRVDRNRGFDRRQTLTLQTNSGANPARLYCPPIQKTQKEVVQLFRGHYTSTKTIITLAVKTSRMDSAAINAMDMESSIVIRRAIASLIAWR
jgi:hypothetical protein